MASSSRQESVSSPSRADAPPKVLLKEIINQLDSAKRELQDLPIPALKEALTKILQLLDRSKDVKGSGEAVRQFATCVQSIQKVTLDPILTAKRVGEVSITEGLSNQLHMVFKDVAAVIPDLSTSKPFRRLFGHVEIDGTLEQASSTIVNVLKRFKSKGEIESTSRTSNGRPIAELRQAGETVYEGPDIPIVEEDTAEQADMQPFVRSVLQRCPRFRILLLGKSGVGKSSLINQIFKVPLADVSHYRAGNADINTEITTANNRHFVLHDSLGYESGSTDNFKVVENFIIERSKRAELSEQLHAIWLCTTVPVAGARVFEVGDERLFEMDLGGMPLIVVFTKYDSLATKIELELAEIASNDDELEARVEEAVNQEFEKTCVTPLNQICVVEGRRPQIPPFTKVSVNSGYEGTLSGLIKITREHVAEKVWLTWAIAQRADADTSVEASVAIGRNKYWKGLASSLYFRDKAMMQCLHAVHIDITLAWNFYDPHEYLSSKDTMALMSQVTEELTDDDAPNSARTLTTGISGVAGVVGFVATMAPPAVIVVAPVIIAAVFAKWVYDVYQQTHGILCCLMAYIVDLTIILRQLFWRMREKGGIQPVSKELINETITTFHNSVEKEKVHRDIRTFVAQSGWRQRVDRDSVLEEVVRLINCYGLDQHMDT